jgi:hypothetical protein
LLPELVTEELVLPLGLGAAVVAALDAAGADADADVAGGGDVAAADVLGSEAAEDELPPSRTDWTDGTVMPTLAHA